MPIVAANPGAFLGQVVDNGQCVRFIQVCAQAPHTSTWRRGAPVRGADIAAGTVIATFDHNGLYGNHTDGSSHAAILKSQDGTGLHVWDQWVGQPVHERTIFFRAGGGLPANDGDQFFVVEIATA